MSDTADKQPKTHSLEDFLDPGVLREIQTAFVAATGVQACFYNFLGEPMEGSPAAKPFCPSPCPQGHGSFVRLARAAIAQPIHGPVCLTCPGHRNHVLVPVLAGEKMLGLIVVPDDPPSRPARPQPCQNDTKGGSSLAGGPATAAATQDIAHGVDDLAAVPENPAVQMAKELAALLGRICYQDSQLRLRIEEAGAIYSITGLLAGSFDLQQVLNEVVRRIGQVMRVKSCSLRLFNEETGESDDQGCL